jgi:hypothetical protein
MELSDKLLNTQEDILYYTAKECGISMEQMEIIEADLWKGIGYYINRPHLVKGFIDLEKFVRFYVTREPHLLKKAQNKIDYYEKFYKKNSTNDEDYKRWLEIEKHFIEKQLIKNGKSKQE